MIFDLMARLQERFVSTIRKMTLPARRDSKYGESLRTLHSAILGVCALIDSFPYSVEPWMPPLTEGQAPFSLVVC
jgi:proteasome activator subunit 4